MKVQLKNRYIASIKYAALMVGMFCVIASAEAQQTSQGLMPASGATVSIDSSFTANEQTHPPLRLTPDKSHIIELDKHISRVIIGNDVHLNLFMDTTSRVVAVPRSPGATHFTLIGADGSIVMQRHVVVASPQEKYVRVRETCMSGSTCEPVRMFYCPGMCHEISIPGASRTMTSGSMANAASNQPAAPSSAPLPQVP
jgi:hypothetical protein